MANAFIKAERVVRTILGLLERDVVVPSLVWRDAAGDFRGAKNDTITIRLPSYFNARTRVLRAGSPKVKDSLHERAVDVSLDTDVYGVIAITDEELTLDIESFERQIIAPVAGGIVRGIEDQVITEIEGAPYVNHLTLDQSDPHKTILKARRHLNESRVPMEGRALIVGSAVEEILLSSDQFVKADVAGDNRAFREAQIGRIYGFGVFTVPALNPEEAYAFHRTAYVLNTRAPQVPRGVAWGATESFNGFAVRVAQQVDPDELVDNFHADAWTGTNHVLDFGKLDTDGTFIPGTDPDSPGSDEEELFVRAVKISVDGPTS